MRIAFIVDKFPALSQTFVLNQIAGLIGQGHELDIYARMPSDYQLFHPDIERYDLVRRTHYWHLPREFILRELKGSERPSPDKYTSRSLARRILNFLRYGRKMKAAMSFYETMSFLISQQYDIMHCHFGPNAIVGAHLRASGFIKAKLITAFHGYDVYRRFSSSGRDAYRRLFNEGDIFMPVSSHMIKHLIDLGCDEDKIMLHHMGVEIDRFSFRSHRSGSKDAVRLISIGRFVEKKGIEYGIRAVAKLIKSNKKIVYNIVGDGLLKNKLQRVVEELGIGPVVKFLGWKGHDEIAGLLADSDILLAPSVTGEDGDKEGIPVAIMEAMAIGLPVLATEHSGIPELIEDGISGFLVPERDVDSLAEKLDYLAGHPEVWPEMGRAGRAFVEKHHDIDKLNDRLVEIYKGLLKE